MYEAGHTLAEAKSIDAIVQRRVAAAKPAEQTAAPDTAPKKPGVKPVEQKAAEQKPGANAGAEGGDVVAEFEARVKTLTDGGMTRQKAAQKVLGADDEFRQAYIAAKAAK